MIGKTAYLFLICLALAVAAAGASSDEMENALDVGSQLESEASVSEASDNDLASDDLSADAEMDVDEADPNDEVEDFDDSEDEDEQVENAAAAAEPTDEEKKAMEASEEFAHFQEMDKPEEVTVDGTDQAMEFGVDKDTLDMWKKTVMLNPEWETEPMVEDTALTREELNRLEAAEKAANADDVEDLVEDDEAQQYYEAHAQLAAKERADEHGFTEKGTMDDEEGNPTLIVGALSSAAYGNMRLARMARGDEDFEDDVMSDDEDQEDEEEDSDLDESNVADQDEDSEMFFRRFKLRIRLPKIVNKFKASKLAAAGAMGLKKFVAAGKAKVDAVAKECMGHNVEDLDEDENGNTFFRLSGLFSRVKKAAAKIKAAVPKVKCTAAQLQKWKKHIAATCTPANVQEADELQDSNEFKFSGASLAAAGAAGYKKFASWAKNKAKKAACSVAQKGKWAKHVSKARSSVLLSRSCARQVEDEYDSDDEQDDNDADDRDDATQAVKDTDMWFRRRRRGSLFKNLTKKIAGGKRALKVVKNTIAKTTCSKQARAKWNKHIDATCTPQDVQEADEVMDGESDENNAIFTGSALAAAGAFNYQKFNKWRAAQEAAACDRVDAEKKSSGNVADDDELLPSLSAIGAASWAKARLDKAKRGLRCTAVRAAIAAGKCTPQQKLRWSHHVNRARGAVPIIQATGVGANGMAPAILVMPGSSKKPVTYLRPIATNLAGRWVQCSNAPKTFGLSKYQHSTGELSHSGSKTAGYWKLPIDKSKPTGGATKRIPSVDQPKAMIKAQVTRSAKASGPDVCTDKYDADAASLAFSVYKTPNEPNYKDWRHVKSVTWSKHGFYSAVYVSDSKKLAILAFRGTEKTSIKDWLTNFHITRTKCDYQSNCGTLHKGYKRNYDHTKEQLRKALEEYSDLGYSLIVTGHSMGGGLATVSALDVKKRFGFSRVNVVTFGSPRVANAQYVSAYNKAFPCARRYVSEYKGGHCIADEDNYREEVRDMWVRARKLRKIGRSIKKGVSKATKFVKKTATKAVKLVKKTAKTVHKKVIKPVAKGIKAVGKFIKGKVRYNTDLVTRTPSGFGYEHVGRLVKIRCPKACKWWCCHKLHVMLGVSCHDMETAYRDVVKKTIEKKYGSLP